MTKKAATPLPCLRSHDISRFTPPSKDQDPGDEEILRLVQQMPSLCTYEDTEDEGVCGTGPSKIRKVDYKSSLRLVVPPDVDPASAASLEPSWFVNIVVTITDRNGCVIYHEAHFPKNPSLREGIKNFLDVRWGDFVHPPDADIWGHHLAEAFAEADRWRAARLAASQYPPPPTTTENGGGSGAGGQQRRRRVSSGGGVLQQQVVSTTSRLSPDVTDSATEEALRRRFVLSSLYRARWGGPNNFFYFRTVSLPFLRNQSDGGEGDGANDDRAMTTIANETTNVFSPTSSFENLLLLNYHCILGRVPEASMAEAVSTSEKTVFDAVALKVAQNPTDFVPLKSGLTPSSLSHPATTTSHMEQLSRVFCFDNLLVDGNESGQTTKFGLENQPTDFYRCRNSHRRHQQQGDHSSRAYRFTEALETPLSSLPVGSHAASYSSAHLAPVDIDWIDQSQPVEHQQQQWQQHYSGTPQVTSTVVRKSGVASNVECQKESSTITESPQQRHQSQRFQTPSNLLETSPSPSPTLPPELGNSATQHDRISIFLSLLLPEAIKEIKEAVSAEPDMVARRVRAIVTRHLGPEILSKFFSNPVQTSTTNAPPPPAPSHPLPPPPPSAPRSSTTSSIVTLSAPLSSLPDTRRSTASSKEIDCCGNIIDAPGRTGITTTVLSTSQQSAVPLLLKKSPIAAVPSQPLKRPSLVQELSVASDNDLPPLPAFHNATPGKKDFSTLSSGPFGCKPRGIANAHTPSAQNSGTTVSAYFDTMAGSSPWVAAGRVSQQVVPSLPPPAQSPSSLQMSQATTALRRTTVTPSSSSSSSSSISSQEVHSTAGVLESLLMGGYVAPDSRTRHISGSSSTSITTPTTATTTSTLRHRNVSEVTLANASVAFECRHALSSSGPSSACCQTPKFGATFNFDNEEWPVVASTNGSSSSSNNSPTTGTRSAALNSTSQLLVSPNSSSSCSSLAHLLRHGCPPAPLAPVTATVTVMSTSATTTVTTAGGIESMSSPTLSTACAVRANRMASVTGTTAVLKTATTKPLDCPLSIIVDPQPPNVVKNLTHPSQSFENGYLQSVLSPKTPGHPPKLPILATQSKEPIFFSNEEITQKSCGGSILPHGGSNSGGTIRKPNIRDTSEDEDVALANSSLCRLLQGPDPRWETVTTVVDATSQEDTPVAPPPPPPSFFELPPDVLVVSSVGGGGEVRRTRYDSCPMALRQPSSVPTPPQVDMVSVAPSHSMVAVASTAVLVEAPTSGHVTIAGSTGGGSCRGSSSSAPPSAVNAMDANGSSPVSMERNRRAAAAAAAQIAEEAEHQRRQRPSSRHLLERQRLLFQQNVGQVTTYGSGSHNLLEGTSTPLPQHRQLQQSQPSCGYCNSGSDIPPTSAAVAATSCHPMQVLGTEGFSELDGALPPSTPAVSGPQPHFSVNQRTPLEDFSRRMKEIAPNVRVSPTGYHHHPSVSNLYPADQQRQKIAPLHSTYDCSGGHLSLLDHEYHGHQQIASPPHGFFTANPPQYENSPLTTPPSYTSHLIPIQPKATNNQHHILQPHVNSRPYQHQELQQPQQKFQYRPQPQSLPHHQQYQHLYQPQRAPLPQSSSTPTLRVPEAYSNSSSMGYYESQFGFQQQQQHHLPTQLPPQHHNYVSPLSMALQQNRSLPHSHVKASLREKVTSRCQARGMDVIPTSAAPPPPSLPLSTIAPHSVGSAVSVVIGHKRPHTPETLNHSVVDSDDEFFYGPPPQPQYQGNLENTSCEVDMPFLNDSTYNCYELSQQQVPFPQQPQFAECRSSMLYEPQQYASVCDTSSTDNTSTMAATNSNNDNSKVNEDIQLTADIVNDVLELEALL